ncbi:hypothetical protein MMC13_008180 [Lambiella insularis]|nr:hypothetical protein [Lambiella insularis]
MSSRKTRPKSMQHISPASLTSLQHRLAYTTSFLNFTESDGAAINASGPLIAPLLQNVLNAIYSKLLEFDITAKAFVPKTSADHSDTPVPSAPHDLSLEHGHIRRQMNFLKDYLLKIVRNEDWSTSSPLWDYMDKVAIAHTGLPGFQHRAKRPELRVEYMQLGLLLGYVEDVVVGAVMHMETIDLKTKTNVIREWAKLLWLQNDLFARRYVVDRDTGETPVGLDTNYGLGEARTWGPLLLGLLFGLVMGLILNVTARTYHSEKKETRDISFLWKAYYSENKPASPSTTLKRTGLNPLIRMWLPLIQLGALVPVSSSWDRGGGEVKWQFESLFRARQHPVQIFVDFGVSAFQYQTVIPDVCAIASPFLPGPCQLLLSKHFQHRAAVSVECDLLIFSQDILQLFKQK